MIQQITRGIKISVETDYEGSFLKKNMYGKKIVIGMGAGSISNWMKKLPQLM